MEGISARNRAASGFALTDDNLRLVRHVARITARQYDEVCLTLVDWRARRLQFVTGRVKHSAHLEHRLKLLKCDSDGYSAVLIVVLSKQSGLSICPVSILKLSRTREGLTDILALGRALRVVEGNPKGQLAVWAGQFQSDAEDAAFDEKCESVMRRELLSRAARRDD